MTDYAKSMGESSLRLGLIALISVGILAAVNHATNERIREQERRAQLKVLQEVLPATLYDNDLLNDSTLVTDPGLLGSTEPGMVYRGRLRGQASVVALEATANRGYNGNIHLIIGIRHDGTLTGVRVTQHKETPGLGDGIDAGVSDWILQFSGLSLARPGETRWAVRADDGEFDQFTGATITPRAVVTAVRDALIYHRENVDKIYAAPATEEE